MQASEDDENELERLLLDAEKCKTNVDHQVNLFYPKACVSYVFLQIHIIELYMKTGRLREGWQYCLEVEKNQLWPNSKAWYTCMVEIAVNFEVCRSFLILESTFSV